jgi:integrase
MVLQGLDDISGELSFSDLTRSLFSLFCQQLPGGLLSILQIEQRVEAILTTLEPYQAEKLISPDGIDTKILAELLNEEAKIIASPEVMALLYRIAGGGCMDKHFPKTSRKSKRECNGAHDLTYGEIAEKTSSARFAECFLTVWKYLWVYSREIPGLLTWDPLEGSSPERLAHDIGCLPRNRTPTIPVDVAFCYLDNAIRWVSEYGAYLIEYYNELCDCLEEIRKGRTARRDYYGPQAFSLVAMPKELESLGICRFNRLASSDRSSNRNVRQILSAEDAIILLRTSCFVIIAAFTARRVSEILDLRDDCIKYGADGWDIHFKVRKIGIAGEYEDFVRPVPDIVKIAVDLLISLTKSLRRRIESDIYLNSNLWLIESRGRTSRSSEDAIYRGLDLFADFIEAPLIQGRRWYSRPHQWRRFFAISFFWQNRLGESLSSLSWFLGHLDPAVTMRYILEDIRGGELSEDESSFIVATLSGPEQAIGDIQRLRDMTLNSFAVERIDVIEPDHLKSFVSGLIKDGIVSLDAFSVGSGRNFRSEILVRVTECKMAA